MAIPELYYSETYYNGEDITCYPSSNATDDGKLNMEFNMARLVTRLSSKNFCITNPAYELTPHINASTGNIDGITVGTGECSINGMDLIMEETLFIEVPPQVNQDYYLAFALHRDGTGNVRTDNVKADISRGVEIVFAGVSLAYYEDRIENKDMLYLGKVRWNGTSFDLLEEDEDKYGRIWAEDILCKLLDPKHPDDRRLLLQQWLYNVPDWYVSKEGDDIYGSLVIKDDRVSDKPGILLGVDREKSMIIIKDPSSDNSNLYIYGDLNNSGVVDNTDLTLVQDYINGTGTLTNLQKILADVNGDGVVDEKDYQYIYDYINQTPDVNYGKTGQIYFISATSHGITYETDNTSSKINIGTASISTSSSDSWKLHIDNTTDTNITTTKHLYLQGDQGTHLVSGTNELLVQNHKVTITDSSYPNNKFEINFVDANNIRQTLGKAIWQYNASNKYVSLLTSDVTKFNIKPASLFEADVDVNTKVTVGTSNTAKTVIEPTTTTITNGTSIGTFGAINTTILTDSNGTISISNIADTIKSNVNKGNIVITNKSTKTPYIDFIQGNASYEVRLSKVADKKALDINGELDVTSLVSSGAIKGTTLETTTGQVGFTNGGSSYTSYLKKDDSSKIIYSTNGFNVGQTGNQALKAGTTTLSGNLTVGTSANGVVVTTGGDITAKGTITGNKVLGAVYQHILEYYEKYEDEVIEDGDIVVINEDGYITKPQFTEDCKNVIGICSPNGSVELGTELYTEKTRCPVGILGKMWVKTEDVYLRPGDKVKATVNGVAKVNMNNLEKDLPYIIGTVIEKYKDGKVRINFRPIL